MLMHVVRIYYDWNTDHDALKIKGAYTAHYLATNALHNAGFVKTELGGWRRETPNGDQYAIITIVDLDAPIKGE